MMSQAEFLLARIDEDEAAAQDAADPARVLRECEAKRRIIADLCNTTDIDDDGYHAYNPIWVAALVRAVSRLAAVYHDHPDYGEACA